MLLKLIDHVSSLMLAVHFMCSLRKVLSDIPTPYIQHLRIIPLTEVLVKVFFIFG